MIVKPRSESATYSIDLASRLAVGEGLSLVTVASSPDGLTIGPVSIVGTTAVIDVSGGDPIIYSLVLSITTTTARSFFYSVPVAVRDEAFLSSCETSLTLVWRLRELLHDTLKHSEVQLDSGDAYKWETDDSDTLWTNAELLEHLNTTRMEFFRRRPLHDDTTDMLVRIDVSANQSRYYYDSRIAEIRDIRGDVMGHLAKTTKQALDYLRRDWAAQTNSIDSFRNFQFFEEPQKLSITLYPIPEEDDTLRLSVRRMPLEKLTWLNRNELVIEPEPQWYEILIDGAAALAYKKNDSETLNKQAGIDAQARFDSAVGRPENARDYEARRRNAAMDGPIRAMVY